jgi:O-antigen/teichoic acid export membrane protein
MTFLKQLFAKLLAVTKTRTIKDVLIVTVGMILTTLISAAYIFLVARFLGPARFGLYSTVFAIVVILIDAFDLAINGSLIKFSSKENTQTSALIHYGWRLKLGLGLGLAVLFALISQPLASLIHPELAAPLLLASLIIPLSFLLRFPKSILEAKKKFFQDTCLDISTSFFRLLFLLLVFFFFKLTVLSAITTYILGVTLAFFLGASLIPWNFLKTPITAASRKRFFTFQKWLTLSFILASTHSRIDSVILMKLAGPSVTGIFQAGYRFFIPAIQLASVLSLVFAPRFASFSRSHETRRYLLKAGLLSSSLAAGVLLLIPLAPWLVNLFFGPQYQAAVLPTQILAIGYAAFVAGAPFVSHLIYATARTKLFTFLSLTQLVLLVSLDLLFIPRFQAIGAALAAAITLIILNSLTAFLALSYREK